MSNEQVVWEPLPDGRISWENSVGDADVYLRISNDGQTVEQWSGHWSDDDQADTVDFGHKYIRVCQATTVPAAASVPSEIVEAMRLVLLNCSPYDNLHMDIVNETCDAKDAVWAWIDSLTQEDEGDAKN